MATWDRKKGLGQRRRCCWGLQHLIRRHLLPPPRQLPEDVLHNLLAAGVRAGAVVAGRFPGSACAYYVVHHNSCCWAVHHRPDRCRVIAAPHCCCWPHSVLSHRSESLREAVQTRAFGLMSALRQLHRVWAEPVSVAINPKAYRCTAQLAA